MSKADMALLQKQLAARSVREMVGTTRPSSSMSGTRGGGGFGGGASSHGSSPTLFGGNNNQTAAGSTSALPALISSPKQSMPSPMPVASASASASASVATLSATNTTTTGASHGAVDEELVDNLSTKILNTKTGFRRKVQAKLQKKKKNPAFDSTPQLLSLKEDTVYMPKGERIDPNRKDGITLSQLYSFKKVCHRATRILGPHKTHVSSLS